MANLKPQDVLIALKLQSHGKRPWTFKGLAHDLHMSSAEVFDGVHRLEACHLYSASLRRVLSSALLEFLSYGLPYVFPASAGVPVVGIPTAASARPLRDTLVTGAEDELVWPHAEGTVRGRAVEPLYRSAPEAAQEDEKLHELLALVDSIRLGRAREKELARQELKKRILQ
jgi:hypothetical protein